MGDQVDASVELDAAALAAEEVISGLKKIYKKAVLPLEKDYKYDVFFQSPLADVDFEAKPMVLVLGQYSTGKTSFIKHLIGRDFPGMRIGPEPTTDKFRVVYYGGEDQVVPGTVLQNNPDLPFRSLGQFGGHFLNKFEGACCSSNALKSFTFVDTPGVLSGKKQKNRQYPYEKVVEWFANRADRILIFFDGSKLDISDEFREVIGELRNYDEKIRIVLNKADSISEKELIRVYGALMWSLGKVFKTPEVPKVYISSFHSEPLKKDNYMNNYFKEDAYDLIGELKSLPRFGAMNKINETLKRMRLVKVHAQIIAELRDQLPYWGKAKKQTQLIEELPNQFRQIARKTGVPPADFPSLEKFQQVLKQEDLALYPKMNPERLKNIDRAMNETIPSLVKRLNDKTVNAGEVKNFNPFDGRDKDTSDGGAPEEVTTVVYPGSAPNFQKSSKSGADASRKLRNSASNVPAASLKEIGKDSKFPPSPSASVVPVPKANSEEEPFPDGVTSVSRNIAPNRNQRMSIGSVEVESVLLEDLGGPRKLPRKPSHGGENWVVSMVEKTDSDNIFFKQRLVNNKLTGKAAKKAFASLNLPNRVMMKIWVLVDFSGANELDSDQFALAWWLAKRALNDKPVPDELTWEMLPPSYRE